MICLSKNQLDFLISLSKVEKLSKHDIPNEDLKMLYFLNDKGLIEIHRDIIRYRLGEKVGEATPIYGEIEAVSISEQGTAYLSERKYNFKSLILKDVFIPIIVTLITNLLIFGMQWLLPLIQRLLTDTQK